MRIPWGGASDDYQFNSWNCGGASRLVIGGVGLFANGDKSQSPAVASQGERTLGKYDTNSKYAESATSGFQAATTSLDSVLDGTPLVYQRRIGASTEGTFCSSKPEQNVPSAA